MESHKLLFAPRARVQEKRKCACLGRWLDLDRSSRGCSFFRRRRRWTFCVSAGPQRRSRCRGNRRRFPINTAIDEAADVGKPLRWSCRPCLSRQVFPVEMGYYVVWWEVLGSGASDWCTRCRWVRKSKEVGEGAYSMEILWRHIVNRTKLLL